MLSTKNPREAAFLALFEADRHTTFIHQWLEVWRQKVFPSDADYRLAQEIAFGSMRMKLALDYYARQLSDTFKAKPKILALIRTAIYQAKMMDKIPLYAIVNETVALAKKYFSVATANFLNALLRKVECIDLHLPQSNSPQDISIRLSYPLYLVQLFINQFGLKTALKLLQLGNLPSIIMAKEIATGQFTTIPSGDTHQYATNEQYYIQNSTPAMLFKALAEKLPAKPKKFLDLCASPGGKLLLAHDYFPDAELFANDISEPKLSKLKENLGKYNVEATLTCGKGEEYAGGYSFDLVVLDVPCSNTGVLNKRPEARWRVDKDNLKSLSEQSQKLLDHACSLLAPQGRLWFMTCSILKEENESVLQNIPLPISFSKLILPDENGADGGFAAELISK